MFQVKNIDEVMKTYPEFKLGWKALPFGGLEHPKFGRLSHVVVCKEDGSPIFDQYMIEEKRGAVIVPYDKHNGVVRVGLITEERFIPRKTYISLPRGFVRPQECLVDAAIRECLEETGHHQDSVRDLSAMVLSENNPNTAFYKTQFPILAVEFYKLEELSEPEGDRFAEKIRKAKPYTFSEIRKLEHDGMFQCGITKAALFAFGCYMPEFFKG